MAWLMVAVPSVTYRVRVRHLWQCHADAWQWQTIKNKKIKKITKAIHCTVFNNEIPRSSKSLLPPGTKMLIFNLILCNINMHMVKIFFLSFPGCWQQIMTSPPLLFSTALELTFDIVYTSTTLFPKNCIGRQQKNCVHLFKCKQNKIKLHVCKKFSRER